MSFPRLAELELGNIAASTEDIIRLVQVLPELTRVRPLRIGDGDEGISMIDASTWLTELAAEEKRIREASRSGNLELTAQSCGLRLDLPIRFRFCGSVRIATPIIPAPLPDQLMRDIADIVKRRDALDAIPVGGSTRAFMLVPSRTADSTPSRGTQHRSRCQ